MFTTEKEEARRELLTLARLLERNGEVETTTVQMFAAAVVDYLNADRETMAQKIEAMAKRDGVTLTPGMGAREYSEIKAAQAVTRVEKEIAAAFYEGAHP